jgi:hypothetical protein
MPLYYPSILKNSNPSYALVDATELRGNAYFTGSNGNQYGIPEDKRQLGMIVYFSSSQDFKYYKGNSTASAHWGSPLSWSMFGGGTTYTEGPGIIIDDNNVLSASLGYGLEFSSSFIQANLGEGLDFDNLNQIQALVRTVNGTKPTNGNIPVSLTAVLTGPSASGAPNNLIESSSGDVTGSITNATVWVVSGDTSTPDPDGLAYIFISQSSTAGGAGEWLPLSYINQDTADLRYVRLKPGNPTIIQSITSSLNISGSSITFTGSLYWKSGSNSGAKYATGGTNHVVVLSSSGELYVTGAYGAGGGSTPSALTFGTQTANYSLLAGDNNTVVRMLASTNLEVYVTASNFSSGDQVIVFQSGSGQVTFIPDATTEMLSANNMRKLRTQYSAATLAFTGNTCYLFGDIAP